MNSNQSWAAVSRALAAVTVMVMVTLVLAPTAPAASKYKTLYKFAGGANGYPSRQAK
jgi:hypothetical protein